MKTASLLLLCVCLCGCSSIPNNNYSGGPVKITADGTDYYTCQPFYVSDGSPYEISFADVPAGGGGKIQLKGVKTLTIADQPTMVDAPMPYPPFPDPKIDNHDSGGNLLNEGQVYTAADGSKARLQNGQWVPVKEPNTICKEH